MTKTLVLLCHCRSRIQTHRNRLLNLAEINNVWNIWKRLKGEHEWACISAIQDYLAYTKAIYVVCRIYGLRLPIAIPLSDIVDTSFGVVCLNLPWYAEIWLLLIFPSGLDLGRQLLCCYLRVRAESDQSSTVNWPRVVKVDTAGDRDSYHHFRTKYPSTGLQAAVHVSESVRERTRIFFNGIVGALENDPYVRLL